MSRDFDPLSLFHPLVSRWFAERVGEPTPVQTGAWPMIAAGEHVLVTAPTGSGKTLTAFLWALDRLITGAWPGGDVRVLYVSPLKALNNDVRRNLLSPLAGLRSVFNEAGEPFPDLRVFTRSGDTPQADRRRMIRRPPEILITTPESLNLLLSSVGGRSILTGLRVVILDEIHAVFGAKRGVHLMTAVDRLVRLGGEFQRIALSATVKPLEVVAEFVGGRIMTGPPDRPEYTTRPVTIFQAPSTKKYSLDVGFPETAPDAEGRDSVWPSLAEEFKTVIHRNRSTLLFANSRRLAEKVTALVNQGRDERLAYAHHGSLSREVRAEVEQKLKNGELRAIVATNSLELGIDVGELDEVVMVQSPASVSSALQRLGRSGHRIDQVSRGLIFPTHAQDCLEAAVLTRAVLEGDIEPAKPVDGALDVLAQIMVSMTAMETWDVDELYAWLRSSHPYRDLPRRWYDLVLGMLAGRYAGARLRELKPRVSIDRLDNTVSARPGALLDIYMSGGVIPDRGYYHLRHFETDQRLGELDEEFVWEARVGQTFTLGAQNWRIHRITHNDVFVHPAGAKSGGAPFWRAEGIGRDFHLSEKIGLFLEEADAGLDDPDFEKALARDYRLLPGAAEMLLDFLRSQKERTGRPLPHRRHVLVEKIETGPGGAPGRQMVIHNFWGLQVNRPYAMALEAAWSDRFGERPPIYASNDAVVLQLPVEVDAEEGLSLVSAADLDGLLARTLEQSGFFAARFRECAGRALLLTRRKMTERMPLWMTRLRARKLFEAVRGFEDFPIVVEAWRTCLEDEFDLAALRRVLNELESGEIGWSQARTAIPSPMARTIAWRQVNEYMYMEDEVPAGGAGLGGDLMRELVFNPDFRPVVPLEVAEEFRKKVQRLAAGYSPATARELLDWVKERVMIPGPEWHVLLEGIRTDHGLEAEAILGELAGKLALVQSVGAEAELVCAMEDAPRVALALGDAEWSELFTNRIAASAGLGEEDEDPDEALTALLGEWLRFYAPLARTEIADKLGLGRARLDRVLDGLIEARSVISGRLTEGGDEFQVCDGRNFEILLRLARSAARPDFQPLPVEKLPLFLADWQGLVRRGDDPDALADRLDRLLCLLLPAALWENEVLPARMTAYDPAWLDALLQNHDLVWVGGEKKTAAFCPENELDLMFGGDTDRGGEPEKSDGRDLLEKLFPDPGGRYDFKTLLGRSGLSAPELDDSLWSLVWEGKVVNDAFAALRKGLETGFKPPETAAAHRHAGHRGRTGGLPRWKEGAARPGSWRRTPRAILAEDLIEREERNKERVRLLFDRYGVLCRDLLQREAPAFRWSAVFRTLRLMELAGEVTSGLFFLGLSGPQFVSRRALHRLRRQPSEKPIYWLSATDPASPCGLNLEAFKGRLPRRLDANHLVFRGDEIALISEREGRTLTINPPPDDPDLAACFAPLSHLLRRRNQPLRRIRIETINGQDAAQSPYFETLVELFEANRDHKQIVLYRKPGDY